MTKEARWFELELRHLSYAIAVRDHRGFIPAALSLDVDQGFLSKQIRSLEKRVGITLFDRKTRPLGITPSGHFFLEEAELILSHTHRAVEVAQEMQEGKRGRLDIGINTSIANTLLPKLLGTFEAQFPNVDVLLHELPSYEQIKQLEKHLIDVGFFHLHSLLNQEKSIQLETVPVYCETFVAVLPNSHRLSGEASISLASLKNELFVLPPYHLTNGLRQQIEQMLTAANCRPKVIREAAWITTVLSLVSGGHVVSILPANARNLHRAGVVFRDIADPSPVLEIVAAKASENASPILKNFFDILQHKMRQGAL